jgi:hypothetical protein
MTHTYTMPLKLVVLCIPIVKIFVFSFRLSCSPDFELMRTYVSTCVPLYAYVFTPVCLCICISRISRKVIMHMANEARILAHIHPRVQVVPQLENYENVNYGPGGGFYGS